MLETIGESLERGRSCGAAGRGWRGPVAGRPRWPSHDMRVMTYPLMLLAAVALITDVTRTTSGDGGLVVTSLAEHWRAIAPATFEAARAPVTRRAAAGCGTR